MITTYMMQGTTFLLQVLPRFAFGEHCVVGCAELKVRGRICFAERFAV
jgi:hypothetical protein